LIGLHTVSIGTLDSAMVMPREVFKAALLANAARILAAHNHPSGDPEPSAEDRLVTARLKQAGEILGIELVDHLILGEHGLFVSFKAIGLL
jgi:DNA repair protein RadC